MNVGFNLKRPLHRLWNKRFQPSKWYCFTEKKHVPKEHSERYPSHVVRNLGVKLTRPKPEQFRRQRRVTLVQPGDPLPSKVDYRPILEAGGFDGPYDQKNQGSCTAQTGIEDKAAQEILTSTYPGERFSAAFLYYQERALHGWENEDSGAMMEDIGTVLGTDGVCLNSTMPYDPNDYTTAPDQTQKDEATQWTTNRDQTRLSWGEVKAALVEGPVMIDDVPVGWPRIGVPIYSSFTQSEYNGGWVPIPEPSEELLGGHALLVVGYDDYLSWGGHIGYYIVLNSWGSIQGAKGYQYFPYDYEFLTGPQSDNWQQFDETPGPGPGPDPTTCEDKYADCVAEALENQAFWQMIVAAITCVINYWICAFSLLGLRTALKKKKTMTKTFKPKGGGKFKLTITISEPKK